MRLEAAWSDLMVEMAKWGVGRIKGPLREAELEVISELIWEVLDLLPSG
jgi:hypothetical protein